MSSSDIVKHRLHWVASVVAGLRSLPQLLPILIVAALSGQSDDGRLWPIAIALAVLPLSLLVGFVRWWQFRYWVENGELRIEQGLFVRRRVYLPRERIQAIDVTAGVVQRAFGLVRVQVKSAAASSQAELSAVTRREADRLRAELGQATRVDETPRVVRHAITPGQLVLAASTSGQIGVILSGVAWLYSQVDELVHQRIAAYLDSANVDSIARTNPLMVAALVASGLLIAWFLSIIGAIVRYGGFAVERQGDDLVIRRGLLEHREIAIPVNRVQAVRIVEELARQPFGYGALYIESAGHAEERGRSTYLHPCLPRDQWIPILRDLLPDLAVDPPMQRPPRRAIVRFLARPIAVATILATGAVAFVPYGWIACVLPVVMGVVGLLAFRDTGLGTTESVAVLQTRGFTRHTAVVPRRRIQFASVARSWLQRRRRVADIQIGAASGASGRRFEARELDETTASEFLSWLGGSGSDRS